MVTMLLRVGGGWRGGRQWTVEILQDPCRNWPSEMITGDMLTRETAAITRFESMLDNITMCFIDGP